MISYGRLVRLISEKFRQKQENDTSTNVSDATSGVGDQLLEYHLLFTERAILRMHAKKMCQTSVEVDFHPLSGECSPSLDHERPVTVQDNVGSRQPISLHLSEKTVSAEGDEEVAGNSVQFRGNRGYFDKHYLSVTVPTPLTLTARSIMVQELAVAGIRISAIHSTAAALVHDFIAGGDAVKRKHAQDLLDQHHGHCRLLVVEVGQGFTCCSVVLLHAIPSSLTSGAQLRSHRDSALETAAAEDAHTQDASTCQDSAYRSVVMRVEDRAGSCVFGLEESDAACLIDWIGSLQLNLNSTLPSPFTPSSATPNAQQPQLAEEDWVIASGDAVDPSWAHSPQRSRWGAPVSASSDSAQEAIPAQQQRFSAGHEVWVALRQETRAECLSALRSFRYSEPSLRSQNQTSSSSSGSDDNSHITELCSSLLTALQRDDGWCCPASPYYRMRVGSNFSSPNHDSRCRRAYSGDSYGNGDEYGRGNIYGSRDGSNHGNGSGGSRDASNHGNGSGGSRDASNHGSGSGGSRDASNHGNGSGNGCMDDSVPSSMQPKGVEGEGQGRVDTDVEGTMRMSLSMPHTAGAKQRLIAALNLYGSSHCPQLDLAFQISRQLENILPRRAEDEGFREGGKAKKRKPTFSSTRASTCLSPTAAAAAAASSSTDGIHAIHGILMWCDCPALSLVIQDPPVVDSRVKKKASARATQKALEDADIIMSMHIFFAAALRGALREFLEVVMAAPSFSRATTTTADRHIESDICRHREGVEEKELDGEKALSTINSDSRAGDGGRGTQGKPPTKKSTNSFWRGPPLQTAPPPSLPRTLWPLRPASLRDGCTGLTRHCASAYGASSLHPSAPSGISGSIRVFEGLCASLSDPFGVCIRRTVDLPAHNASRESGKRKEGLSTYPCVRDSNVVWIDGPTAEGEFDVILRYLPSGLSSECSIPASRSEVRHPDPAAVPVSAPAGAAEAGVVAVHSIAKESAATGAAALRRMHAGTADASVSVSLGPVLGAASLSPSGEGNTQHYADAGDLLDPLTHTVEWSVIIVQRVEQDLEVLKCTADALQDDEEKLKEDADKVVSWTILCSVALPSYGSHSLSHSLSHSQPTALWLLSLRASREGEGLYTAQATMLQQSRAPVAASPLGLGALSHQMSGAVRLAPSDTPAHVPRYVTADLSSKRSDKGEGAPMREEWKAASCALLLCSLILKCALCAIVILQLNMCFAVLTGKPIRQTWTFAGYQYVQHFGRTELVPLLPSYLRSHLFGTPDYCMSTGHCTDTSALSRTTGDTFITMRKEWVTDRGARGEEKGEEDSISTGTSTDSRITRSCAVGETRASVEDEEEDEGVVELHRPHRPESSLDVRESGDEFNRNRGRDRDRDSNRGLVARHLVRKSAGVVVRGLVDAVKRRMRTILTVFRWIFGSGTGQ